MPNNWIKERGTGVHKRHLCKSAIVANDIVTGLKLIPDPRYPTPYFKAKNGTVVIRSYPDGFEVLVNEAAMRATVDSQITELLKAMPAPDNL
jgi:hypothetical protein